jgi:hypothetical protein
MARPTAQSPLDPIVLARTKTETKNPVRATGGADLAFRSAMSNHSELPSARQILESDTAALRGKAEPACESVESPDDEDFRRILTALRVVLKMGGS